MPKQM